MMLHHSLLLLLAVLAAVLLTSHAALVQTTTHITMGEPLAQTRPWTIRTSVKCGAWLPLRSAASSSLPGRATPG